MPICQKFSSMKLKQFVGSDSWTLFNLIGVDPNFLHVPVSEWPTNENYKKIFDFVKNLSVVNDSAERALGLLTEFHMDKITRSKEQ